MDWLSNQALMWPLVILTAISSFISIYLVLRVIKKFDEFQIVTYEAFEILNGERIKLLKEIELLQRRSRMLNNEAKENNRRKE